MYEFKVDIEKKEYIKFIEDFSCAPITQDYRWAKVKKDWDSTLCALYKDDKIVGAALLLIKTFPMNLKMIYSPKGFLIDYTNKEYLEEFTKGIKEYAKKIKAFVIKIDPLIAVNEEYYDTFIKKSDKKSPQNYINDKDLWIYFLLGFVAIIAVLLFVIIIRTLSFKPCDSVKVIEEEASNR